MHDVSGLIQASLRSLPTQTGDGTYIKEPPSTGPILDLLKTNVHDVKTIIDVVKGAALGKDANDRKYQLEHIVQVCMIWSI